MLRLKGNGSSALPALQLVHLLPDLVARLPLRGLDGPLVPQVTREGDSRGSAFAEIAFDEIAVSQGSAQAREDGVGQRELREFVWDGL